MTISSFDELNVVGILKRIYLIYVFVRVALHQVLFLPDGAGRTLFLFNIFFLFNFLLFRRTYFKNIGVASLMWFVWCIYAFLNTLLQGLTFDMDIWQFFNYLITPFVSFVLSYNIFSISKRPTFIFYLGLAAFTNVFVYAFFASSTDYSEGVRLGGELINSNTIAQVVSLGIIVLTIAGYFNLFSRKIAVILIVFSFVIVLSTGSRLGFIISVLYITYAFFLFTYNKLKKRFIPILFSIVIFLFLFQYFSRELIVLERLKTTKIEGETLVKTGSILDYLGGRGVYYLYGYEVFIDNPFFGVGLNNYRKFNPISHQPNHVEFMIQLSELGVMGSLLFIFFFIALLSKLNHVATNDKIFKFFVLFTILGIILMGGGYWLHNQQIVFIILGTSLGIQSNQNQIYLRNLNRL